MTHSTTCDFLVIGAGIIGLSLSRHFKKNFPQAKIIVIEKENQTGLHASGRNSGVLHAGFYYTADSLKAKFSRIGNQLLTQYCEQKKIPIHQCGKIVVAKDEHDLTSLDILLKRAKANGVLVNDITAAEAQAIEPRALTFKRALFSPTTSSVNPKTVIEAIQRDAENEGIFIHCETRYLKNLSHNRVMTNKGQYEAGYIINAAGLYADKIAKDFGFSQHYQILPFKGFYLYSNEPLFSIGTHIYPVPDLNYPFLGVHLTVTAEGQMKIGPTAVPAFWREQYRLFERFKLTELIDIFKRQLGLFLYSQFDFKKLALAEIRKCSKNHLIKQAAQLIKGIKKENFTHFGPSGIRAQLLDTRTRKLEMDFVLEGDNQSMHILNAVSPGFTSAFSFSQYIFDRIQKI